MDDLYPDPASQHDPAQGLFGLYVFVVYSTLFLKH
jgi:hypothetical protein